MFRDVSGTEGMNAFLLLVVFQAKHFLADFPFQNAFMLRKRLPGWGFALPLAAHCGVHGLFTLAVCLWARPEFWWLAGVDFAAHFVMDRIKAGPRYLGRYTDPKTSAFWNCFGVDQMVHQLTYVFIAWRLAA